MNATLSTIDTLTDAFDAPTTASRPTLGALLLFTTPLSSAILFQGARTDLTDALHTNLTTQTLATLAITLLLAQATLGIRAGQLALRGDARGTDLTATAMLLALTACVLLFLAGARLDYLGWGLALLTTQATGMFQLDTDTANAWYTRRTA